MRKNQSPSATDPSVFVSALYLSRLRTKSDREKAMGLFRAHFPTCGAEQEHEVVYRVTESQVTTQSSRILKSRILETMDHQPLSLRLFLH